MILLFPRGNCGPVSFLPGGSTQVCKKYPDVIPPVFNHWILMQWCITVLSHTIFN